jgi:hypothetical protein
MLRGMTGTGAAKKQELLASPPAEFATGYPRLVWAFEAARATTGPERPPCGTPLLGRWPMTPEQEEFFAE